MKREKCWEAWTRADYYTQQLLQFLSIECWEDKTNQHNWTGGKNVIYSIMSNNDLTSFCVRWEHLFRGKENLAPWRQWINPKPRTSAFHSSRLRDQGLEICISSSRQHCRRSSRAEAFQFRANSKWYKQDWTCLAEEMGSSFSCLSPFSKIKDIYFFQNLLIIITNVL